MNLFFIALICTPNDTPAAMIERWNKELSFAK